MCESAQIYSTYENKLKVVVDLSDHDLSNLLNSIPKDDILNHLDESVLEEWARSKGYTDFS